ncbi:unnamed protein product [Polarella glacialis]|uniref:Uncharacterized protein n=1 Tax=Polarella glacialis TaxID=89957 RepID=A0A813KPW1_POLGL|nr:unnamed protein product [Polarella glacialis]CAE8712911.1 unnamed protein product [Polarella glacialis]
MDQFRLLPLAGAAAVGAVVGAGLATWVWQRRQQGGRSAHNGQIRTEKGLTYLGSSSSYAVAKSGVRGLLAYNREAGVSVEEYDRWLYKEHYHDLLANPSLRGITLHQVLDEKPRLSSGKEVEIDPAIKFWRLAELHFDSLEDYWQYVAWFQERLIPQGRTPAGKSAFRFYVLGETQEIWRS